MKLIEITADIETFKADALVYSTNQNLHLSGGVGASLLAQYGDSVQQILDKHLAKTDGDFVEVGSIFEGRTNEMPWKRVFHTVATDLEYNTNLSTVSRLINDILQQCELDYSIHSIVFSALGSGYGSLSYEDFVKLLNSILSEYSSETFTVYVANKKTKSSL